MPETIDGQPLMVLPKGAPLKAEKKRGTALVRKDRQEKVYQLVREGNTFTKIGEILGVSTETVRRDFRTIEPIIHEQLMERAKGAALREYHTLDELKGSYMNAALNGDDRACAVVIKIHEKIVDLLGLKGILQGQLNATAENGMSANSTDANPGNVDVGIYLVSNIGKWWVDLSAPILKHFEEQNLDADKMSLYIRDLRVSPIAPQMLTTFRGVMPDADSGAFVRREGKVIGVDSICGVPVDDLMEKMNEYPID